MQFHLVGITVLETLLEFCSVFLMHWVFKKSRLQCATLDIRQTDTN